MRKEFYKCTESLEKTLHQPLFNVFRNEDIGCWTSTVNFNRTLKNDIL